MGGELSVQRRRGIKISNYYYFSSKSWLNSLRSGRVVQKAIDTDPTLVNAKAWQL